MYQLKHEFTQEGDGKIFIGLYTEIKGSTVQLKNGNNNVVVLKKSGDWPEDIKVQVSPPTVCANVTITPKTNCEIGSPTGDCIYPITITPKKLPPDFFELNVFVKPIEPPVFLQFILSIIQLMKKFLDSLEKSLSDSNTVSVGDDIPNP